LRAARSGGRAIRTINAAIVADPGYVEQNRKSQRRRNQSAGSRLIVKNNLAVDVKRLPAAVRMTGPGLEAIVKNNLAISQVVVFQTVDECRGEV
jgi:hypothetical protein